MNRWVQILGISLPLVFVVGGIVRSEMHIRAAQNWVFQVRGYDPRDLLRGRYMQFRLDYEVTDARCGHSDDCCLCLTSTGEESPPLVSERSCGDASRCDGRLRKDELPNIRRFYVAEDRAREYETALRSAARKNMARVGLAISRDGRPQILWMQFGDIRLGRDAP